MSRESPLGQEKTRQRDGRRQVLLLVDQKQRIERFQQLFVAFERRHGVRYRGAIVEHHVFRIDQTAGGIVIEFQQPLHFDFGLGIHLFEDLLRGFILQFGKDVGSLGGGHLFHDVSCLFRLESLQNAGLHLGIFHFGKRVGGGFAVDGIENRFALGGAKVLDDVGEVGGMHVFQLFVRNVQPQAAQRVGFHHVGKLPADGVRGNAALQAPDRLRRQHPLKGGGTCCGRRYPPRAR